jgi:hypothetical protein
LLISHLVAVRIDEITAEAVERIAPGLAVTKAAGQVPEAGPAWREQVRGLIADLLDERAAAQGLENAMRGERMVQFDAGQAIMKRRMPYEAISGQMFEPDVTPPIPLWVAVLGRPVMESDTRRMLLHMEQWVRAAGSADWPGAARIMPSEHFWSRGMMNLLTHPLSRFLVPSLDRTFVLHFRSLAMRRMAAVRLALRLYELDHGQRPDSLDLLVPDYLAALPADPYAEAARSFGYLPNAAPPILYAIGPNGDDDGRIGVNPDYLDIPFFLNGDRPHAPLPTPASAPASGQAANDNHEVEHDVGNGERDEKGGQP